MDANIKGTEDVILLGRLSATLEYLWLARSGAGGFGGDDGDGGTVIWESPIGAFWGLKDRGSAALFVDRPAHQWFSIRVHCKKNR